MRSTFGNRPEQVAKAKAVYRRRERAALKRITEHMLDAELTA